MEDSTQLSTTSPFTQAQVNLIQKTVAKDATTDELKLFLYQAHKTGLDPLARQIYFVKRGYGEKAKVSIQTSIDGFRIIAERSGNYAGQDEPIFIEKDGRLDCAKVTVYKFAPNGNRYPAAVGVAYWDEYCPPAPSDMMWKKMPHTMLAKVAESLALRKSFPQDLSGLYTTEEMNQASTSSQTHTKEVSVPHSVDTKTGEIFYDPDDDFGMTKAMKEVNKPVLTAEVLQENLERKYGIKEKS